VKYKGVCYDAVVKLSRLSVQQFSIYFVNGTIANGIDIGGFYILNAIGIWYIHASLVSGFLGFMAAFLCHKYLAFKKPGKHLQHFAKFCLLGLFNLFAVAFILSICVEWIGLPELLSKIIANGSQVLWGFLLLKFVVYT
jgi:putative flippase GtrA